jgi:hypothetical protein
MGTGTDLNVSPVVSIRRERPAVSQDRTIENGD